MNRLKLLTMATLMALTLTACDEGTPPPVDVPPPPTPVGTISGTVTIDGTSATGITATLSSGATTATGAGGTFSFAGVEAGSYTVTISGYPADAAFPSATQAATIASDGQTVQLNFAGEYIRSSSVVGSVVAADPMMMGSDSNGDMLELRLDMLDGITVTLEGENTMAEPQSTMEGGFAFTGLRAGSYTVTISGYPEDVKFDEASMTVEVGVGEVGMANFEGAYIRTAAVEGRVIIEGEGLAGVTVTLTGGPGNDSYTKLTGDSGEYAFTELRPGDYQVSISGYDADDYEFASSAHDVSVELGETETVSFTGVLLRTSGISGRVSVAGMGIPDIAVTLSGAADDTTMTDASGQYAFAGLAAGDYTVSIAVESAAYVFGSMSSDRTVGDDDSQIVNFEGAHAETASVSGMLFIDELDNNDMHDAGEAPLAQAGIPVALVGPGVNDQRLRATNAQGQFMFSDLRAGPYQLIVPINATVAAALAANDIAYGGPATGYAFDLAVGEPKTQAIPFDITHTTVNFTVSLKHGEDTGDALPGATVTLYSDAAGTTKVGGDETGDDGSTAIKVNRAGTSGNMVHAGVSADGYHVADGLTPVPWNPQIPATVGENANDIVNLNVEVNVTGKTIETQRGGGVELAGWAIEVMRGDEAVEDNLEADGTASFESEVEYADLPATFTFAVAEEQDDDLDNGEEIAADPVTHVHTGLSLDAAQDVAITASFATQTLMVYVYHEKDQVEGFTGNALGDDELMSGVLDVGVRQAASGNRTSAFSSEDWDEDENRTDKGGVLTFAHLPSAANVIVTANAAGENVIIHGSDQLATYEDFDDNGLSQTSSVFGEQGGYHHTVELCPMQAEGGECASFGFIRTYTVDGQAWKNVRDMDSDDGFKAEDTVVGEAGTTVSMEPVADKNLEGEAAEPFVAEAAADKKFDFGRMADGVYAVGVPEGWMATAGSDGDELSEEFLLANTLTSDEDDDDANDHLNIDVTPTTGFLYGIVENQDGVPAEGVTVDVNGEASGVTDEYGRYMVEGFSKQKSPNAAIVVTVSGAGYATKVYSTATTGSTKVPNFAANSPTEYDITVTGSGSAATFTGTVTAAGGGPLSGVEIKVDSPLLNPNEKSRGSKTDNIYKTGADGLYTVMVEANGADVTLTASMKNMSFAPDGYTQQARAGSFPGPNFTGFEYATINGRVTVGNKPQPNVTVEAKGAKTHSDITNSAGVFSISVPYGSYTITAKSRGYGYVYPGGVTEALTINLRPGEDYPFAIKATINADGRPPRFTTTSFNYEENTGSVIGTVKAVDDDVADQKKVTFNYVGANNDLHVTSAGVLQWVGASKSYKTSGSNAYTLDVTVTSTGTDVGSDNDTDQEITVTVTKSDDVQVTLKLNPSSISEASGTSTVTATLEDPAPSEFYVTVKVSVSDLKEVNLSSNKTLTIRKGDTNSSGPPVTITAINDDNDHDGNRPVWVMGSMSPTIANMAVEPVKLTIVDDDLAYGKIVLILKDAKIDETDADADNADTRVAGSTTVSAKVVGGVPFPRDVTVVITAEGAMVGGTLIIEAGERASSDADDDVVTITAADDADAVNTVVTVSGMTSWDDNPDADITTTVEVAKASRPDEVYLTVTDDDVAPGAPTALKVSDGATISSFTLTFAAPSNKGKADGVTVGDTDGDDDITSPEIDVIYQYRYIRTVLVSAGRAGDWTEWAPTSSGTANSVGTSLLEDEGYTVQVQTVHPGDDALTSRPTSATFEVPSS